MCLYVNEIVQDKMCVCLCVLWRVLVRMCVCLCSSECLFVLYIHCHSRFTTLHLLKKIKPSILVTFQSGVCHLSPFFPR